MPRHVRASGSENENLKRHGVQALLISLATAITLAIGGAFAAPLVIDWNSWRASFESALGRTLGLPVVIRGPIEAAILPAPRVVLRDVSLGDVVSTGALVDELRAEVSLGALLKGEIQATGVTLKHPQVRLLIDSSGHVALPVGTRRPTDMTIASFALENGSLDVLDRGTDRAVGLSGIDLNGEARSLFGPYRLEGEVKAPSGIYGVRAMLGEIGADGAGKLRLYVDGRTAPIAFDLDGSLSMADGRPSYAGKLLARRKGGVGLAGWHAAATVRAEPEAVAADTLEIAIGDDTEPAQFSGTARLGLGRATALQADLAARTLDLDTLYAASEAAAPPRTDAASGAGAPAASLARTDSPVAVATDALGLITRLPAVNTASQVKLAVDRLFLGGAPLQMVEAILAGSTDGWRIEKATAQFPGGAEATLAGRSTSRDGTLGFAGEVALAAADPGGFLRWAAPNAAADYVNAVPGPARIASRVSVVPGSLALEGLNASFGNARLDGTVKAALDPAKGPQLDLKLNLENFALEPLLVAARRAAGAVGGGTDASLALTGKALTVSGLAIGTLAVNAQATGGNWQVSRLAMGDLGGLAVEGSGRLENFSTTPRGAFKLTLSGADAKGLGPLARQVAGEKTAAVVERLGPLASPVRLESTVEWREAGGRNIVTEGSLGDISGRLTLTRTNAGVPLSIALTASAKDGAATLGALGLSALAPRLGPAEVVLALDPLTPGEASVKGSLALADSRLAGEGTARLAQDGAIMPRLALRLDSPDLGRLLPRLGRVAEGAALPAAVGFSLTRSGALWRLEDLSGSFARLPARGALGFEPGDVPRIEGRLGFDDLALADVLGLFGVRVPRSAAPAAPWSNARFVPPAAENVVLDVELLADRLAVLGPYVLGDARLKLMSGGPGLDLREISGTLGDGRASAALHLERGGDALKANGRLKLDGVAAKSLLAPAGVPAAPDGRVSLTLDLAGTGRSPRLLVQDLSGGGTIAVENLRIPRAAPGALADVLRQADAMADPPGERVTTRLFDDALAQGPLLMPAVQGALTAAGGTVRLSPVRGQADDVRVGLDGRFDLARLAFDASVELTGPDGPGGAPGGILAWRGGVSDPERRVSATALTGVLAARAVERETRRLEAEHNAAAAARGLPAMPAPPSSAAPAAPVPASAGPDTMPPVVPAPKVSAPAATPAPVPPAPAQPRAEPARAETVAQPPAPQPPITAPAASVVAPAAQDAAPPAPAQPPGSARPAAAPAATPQGTAPPAPPAADAAPSLPAQATAPAPTQSPAPTTSGVPSEDAGIGTGSEGTPSASGTSTTAPPARRTLPPVPRAEPAPPVRRAPPPADQATRPREAPSREGTTAAPREGATTAREPPRAPASPRPPAVIALPPPEAPPEHTLPPTRGFGDLPRPPALVGR